MPVWFVLDQTRPQKNEFKFKCLQVVYGLLGFLILNIFTSAAMFLGLLGRSGGAAQHTPKCTPHLALHLARSYGPRPAPQLYSNLNSSESVILLSTLPPQAHPLPPAAAGRWPQSCTCRPESGC